MKATYPISQRQALLDHLRRGGEGDMALPTFGKDLLPVVRFDIGVRHRAKEDMEGKQRESQEPDPYFFYYRLIHRPLNVSRQFISGKSDAVLAGCPVPTQ